MTIESKLYVNPSGGKMAFKIFLNVSLAIYLLVGIIIIIFEGFSINRIGTLCLAWIIVSGYNASNKPGYQFAILQLNIMSQKIEMLYENVKTGSKNKNIQVSILRECIEKVEYSDQLKAIRIVGNVVMQNDNANKNNVLKEWVAYLGDNSGKVIQELENTLNISVIHMDNDMR